MNMLMMLAAHPCVAPKLIACSVPLSTATGVPVIRTCTSLWVAMIFNPFVIIRFNPEDIRRHVIHQKTKWTPMDAFACATWEADCLFFKGTFFIQHRLFSEHLGWSFDTSQDISFVPPLFFRPELCLCQL